MMQRDHLRIELDRSSRQPLSEQIGSAIRAAIAQGSLEPRTKLPSWRDLASQLGVARGTVRTAYERLEDEQLVVALGAGGTRVASRVHVPDDEPVEERPRLSGLAERHYLKPLPFKMGVPAVDAFPATLWARLTGRIARSSADSFAYPVDPSGHPALRRHIAAHLAVARGLVCHPDRIVVTTGFRHGLSLTLAALELRSGDVWMEEPGYPFSRRALEMHGLRPRETPVDREGLIVSRGREIAPDAVAALVTPGQQAPTGVALSPSRRAELIDWSLQGGGWIIEDDYLSELQLTGRAAPSLAAERGASRVVHIGSFGKTMSGGLSLGFVVSPEQMANRFADVAAFLQPAPSTLVQLTMAEFLSQGHYLRHLRRMKRLYRERRRGLQQRMSQLASAEAMAGLALALSLPDDVDDLAMAAAAAEIGLAPMPLSPWYAGPTKKRGLLLSVTNLTEDVLPEASRRLAELVTAATRPRR